MRIVKICSVSILVLIFAFGTYRSCKKDSELSENGIITTCKINGIFSTAKSGWDVRYIFFVNGLQYSGSTVLQIKTTKGLIGRNIPIRYSANNPEINKLIFYPGDWEDIGLPLPDSMQWVKQYLSIDQY